MKHWFSMLAAVLLVFISPLQTIAEEASSAMAPSAMEKSPLLAPSSLYAEGAVLMDAQTGQVLFEKNMRKKLYPASITKILTCLLAIEEGNPDDSVTVTDEGVRAVSRNATHIALTGGEQLTLEQLNYAMMVQSANDAANAIAIHLAGTMEDFARKMNERAAAIGAKDTHFVNANGLPDDSHVTTAYDMALITRAALAHQEFRSLAGTQKYEIPPTNKQKETRLLNNNQYMFTLNDTYPGAFAGKTGWTQEAGHTLVTIAERNDVTLICVVLHSDSAGIYDCQYKDSTRILDYGYDNFRRVAVPADILTPQEVSFNGSDGQPQTATLRVAEEMSVLLPTDVSVSDLKASVKLPDVLDAQSLSQAKLELTAPAGAMYPVMGLFPMKAELPQPVTAPADEVKKPATMLPYLEKYLPVLKRIGITLGILLVALLILRQILLIRYRRRKRRSSQRIAQAQAARDAGRVHMYEQLPPPIRPSQERAPGRSSASSRGASRRRSSPRGRSSATTRSSRPSRSTDSTRQPFAWGTGEYSARERGIREHRSEERSAREDHILRAREIVARRLRKDGFDVRKW